LAFAVMIIAGCKVTDDKVDTGFTGENGGQDHGSAPTIWGEPARSVLVGTHYAFQPEADDADGDVLEFSIANKPGWASFDATSGLLQGIPGSEHTGVNRHIVISVSDGDSVVSMPSFDIRVESTVTPEDPEDPENPDDGGAGGGSTSAPPTISGKPNTSVVVGQDYLFRPDVNDPDGDSLSFSIVNRPRWLNFNTTTGRLHGTPTEEHIGRTGDVSPLSS
jgi:hypothetical protein